MISQINLRQYRFSFLFLAGCHNFEFRINVANTLLSNSNNSIAPSSPVGAVRHNLSVTNRSVELRKSRKSVDGCF